MNSEAQSLHHTLGALDIEVLDMLREDLPVQHADTTAALDRKEWARAKDIVHAINGSAAFCRIEPLRAAAQALEVELSTPPPDQDVREDFDTIIADVIAVICKQNNNP